MSETTSLGRLACTWLSSFSIRASIISPVIFGLSTPGEDSTAVDMEGSAKCPFDSATAICPSASVGRLIGSVGKGGCRGAMLHYRPLLFDRHQFGRKQRLGSAALSRSPKGPPAT